MFLLLFRAVLGCESFFLTLIMAGSQRVQLWRGGWSNPHPSNFAKYQFWSLKIGIWLAKGICNCAKFVIIIYTMSVVDR